MALQKNFTDESVGIEYTDAYFRIMKINIDSPLSLASTTLQIDVSGFVSKSARDNAKSPVWSQAFQFSITEVDLSQITSLDDMKQRLYNVLKTSDFFLDAVDC